MHKIENKNPKTPVILKPIPTAINNIKNPCSTAVVTPPSVLPKTIETLLTGVTIISFKNPNCLSQMTDIPLVIELKSKTMPIMPGVRKAI